MSNATKKIVAKSLLTGLYFNGVNFNEISLDKAAALPDGTTAQSFSATWSGGVALEERVVRSSLSLAEQISQGLITRELAAGIHIRKCGREFNQKTFTVFVPFTGKYISRIPRSVGGGREYQISFAGSKHTLVWSRGELAIA